MVSLKEIREKHAEYKCFYCGKVVSLPELLGVDDTSANMDEEELEFIYDELPKNNNPRVAPYLHKPVDKEYPILNICRYCISHAAFKASFPTN
jgi:hypothetical protein